MICHITDCSQDDTEPSRHIRVFISSTFKDMMEERDVLMTGTYLDLCDYCTERGLTLTFGNFFI